MNPGVGDGDAGDIELFQLIQRWKTTASLVGPACQTYRRGTWPRWAGYRADLLGQLVALVHWLFSPFFYFVLFSFCLFEF
jgi:hypothetical protein